MIETHNVLNIWRQTGLIVIIFSIFFLGVRLFESVRLFGRLEYNVLPKELEKHVTQIE